MTNSEPTDLQVEGAYRSMYGKNWNGPPDRMPGPEMKEVWRKLARKALVGADQAEVEHDYQQ